MKLTLNICIAFVFISTICGQENDEFEETGKPCLFSETINITDGNPVGNTIQFNGSSFGPGTYAEYDYLITVKGQKINADRHKRGCICKLKDCVRFCSKSREKIQFPEMTEPIYLANLSLHEVHGWPCGDMIVFEEGDGTLEFHENGEITYDDKKLTHNEYCIKQIQGKTLINYCKVDKAVPALLYSTAMIISVPFLFVTFIVYATVPDLQNLYGRSLLCFTGCLTIYFTSLTITIVSNIENRPLCTTLGYFIYYFGLATFFWLNAISIDFFIKIAMYLTSTISAKSDNKKLIKMSIYGFGAPLIFSIIMALLDHTPVGGIFESKHLPKIGQDQAKDVYECFIQDKFYSRVKYFYSILTILLMTNMGLFIWILVRLYMHSKEVNRTTSTFLNDKKRLKVYIKLFILMGVTWIMEPISSYFKDHQAWFYATDTLNCFQGVIIFVVLVLQKNIINYFMGRISNLGSFGRPSDTQTTKLSKSSNSVSQISEQFPSSSC